MNPDTPPRSPGGPPGRQFLLALGLLFYLAFLVSPGFVDVVYGDGSVTMLSGFATTAWLFLTLPLTLTDPGEAILAAPLAAASLAFVALPLLVARGRFQAWALRLGFALLFTAGLVAMSWMIREAEQVALGVYLWLLAALAALGFCLCSPARPSSRTDG